MMLIKVFAATALLAILTPAQAAGKLSYILTGRVNADWTIDANPTPDEFNENFFRLKSVSGNFGQLTSGSVNLDFFVNDSSPNFALSTPDATGTGDVALILLITPEVYTGPPRSPTMLPGNFRLSEFGGPTGGFSLRVTEISPVPETTTWIMIVAGFGLVGMQIRRRACRLPSMT